METAIRALLAPLVLFALASPADAGNPYAEAADRDAALEARTRTAEDANPHRAQSNDDASHASSDQAQIGNRSRDQRYQDDRGHQDNRTYQNDGGRGCGQGSGRNQYGNCVYDQGRGRGDQVWVVSEGVGRWVAPAPQPHNPMAPNTGRNPLAPRIAPTPTYIKTAPPSSTRPLW